MTAKSSYVQSNFSPEQLTNILASFDASYDAQDLVFMVFAILALWRDGASFNDLSPQCRFTRFRRSAFMTTVNDEKAIAAPANIGDIEIPNPG